MALISLYLGRERPGGAGDQPGQPGTNRPVPDPRQGRALSPARTGVTVPARLGGPRGSSLAPGPRHSLVHQAAGDGDPVVGDVLVVVEQGRHLFLYIFLGGGRGSAPGGTGSRPPPRCGATAGLVAPLTVITPKTSLRSNISWK